MVNRISEFYQSQQMYEEYGQAEQEADAFMDNIGNMTDEEILDFFEPKNKECREKCRVILDEIGGSLYEVDARIKLTTYLNNKPYECVRDTWAEMLSAMIILLEII